MKIPLAWLQLSREKIKLLVAIAGIGFADLLMFMQLGFKKCITPKCRYSPRTNRRGCVLIKPSIRCSYFYEKFFLP